MHRRLTVASLTAVVLGTIGLTQGFGLLAPKARAADLLHSRFTNRISGYIIQDLQTGLQGSVPNTAAAPAAGAAPLTPSINTTGCSQTDGTNVRANQDCTNNTSPKYPGRGQAQNETTIAVNPTNANNVLAGQNDYRRGDGSCGADFSWDAGGHWGNVLLPIGF